MEFENKSYNDLKLLLSSYHNDYKEMIDECAKEGLSYNEFCVKAKTLKEQIYLIEKHIKVKEEPTIEYGKEWKGKLLTLENFIEKAKNLELKDVDGIGYYATETTKSNIIVCPSDILENIYRTDFTHILWLNNVI